MALFGDGTSPLSATGFVKRGLDSFQAGDGSVGRRTGLQQQVNLQFKENKAILATEGSESMEL
jgi:hypothetical protein